MAPCPQLIGLGTCTQDYLGVVDRLPTLDTGASLRGFSMQGGGVVATALVAAARLGLRCAYAGAVGDDEIGRRIISDLEAEGVDCSFTEVVPGAASAMSIVLVHGPTGHRSILHNPGNARLSAVTPSLAEAIRRTETLHLDGLDAVQTDAAEVAQAAGTTVSIDLGSWDEPTERRMTRVDTLIAAASWAHARAPRGQELALLRQAQARGPRTTVVTLGDGGCVGIEGEQEVRIAAFDVPVVDTTGAGDVFHGAYLVAAHRGWDFPSRLLFASAVAALKCRALGGRAGIASLAETMDFLRERGVAVESQEGGERAACSGTPS